MSRSWVLCSRHCVDESGPRASTGSTVPLLRNGEVCQCSCTTQPQRRQAKCYCFARLSSSGSHLHALLGSHPPWTHQRTFYCSGYVRTNAAGDELCVGTRDRESGLAHCHAGIGYHPLNTSLFGRDCHTLPGRAQPLARNARIQLWAVNQFRGSYRCEALVRQLWNATNKILFERVLSTLCRRGVIAGPIKLAPLYKPSPQLLAMWQTNGDNDIESALRYPTFAAEVQQQLRQARQTHESFVDAKRSFYEDLGLSGGCAACGEGGSR